MKAGSGRGGRILQATLLAAMLLVLLGHVCAMPAAPHTSLLGAVAAHQQHDSETDESHIASCDATAVKPAQCSPALVVGACTYEHEALPIDIAWTANHVPVVGVPPPLFLLHASFLI